MARILRHDERVWGNWHGTVTGVPIDGRFELVNGARERGVEAFAAAGGRCRG